MPSKVKDSSNIIIMFEPQQIRWLQINIYSLYKEKICHLLRNEGSDFLVGRKIEEFAWTSCLWPLKSVVLTNKSMIYRVFGPEAKFFLMSLLQFKKECILSHLLLYIESKVIGL